MLSVLDLSQNDLSSLQNGVLNNLSQLRTLYLNGNKLKSLSNQEQLFNLAYFGCNENLSCFNFKSESN